MSEGRTRETEQIQRIFELGTGDMGEAEVDKRVCRDMGGKIQRALRSSVNSKLCVGIKRRIIKYAF